MHKKILEEKIYESFPNTKSETFLQANQIKITKDENLNKTE